MDAEALERGLDLLQHLVDRIARQRRELLDVVALVAVVRRLLAPANGFDRGAEPVHLPAGVVVVVLARDVVAGELEQARDRVAVRAVARVRDRERTGRVRRDHLDLYPLARVGRAAAESSPASRIAASASANQASVRKRLTKPGACDLRALDLRQRLRRRRRAPPRARAAAVAARRRAAAPRSSRSRRAPDRSDARASTPPPSARCERADGISLQRPLVARTGPRAAGALRSCRRRRSRRPLRSRRRARASCRTYRRACAARR